jgi:hypothetical protein
MVREGKGQGSRRLENLTHVRDNIHPQQYPLIIASFTTPESWRSDRKERTAKAAARALEQKNEVIITIKMVEKPKHNQEIRPSGRPVEFLA